MMKKKQQNTARAAGLAAVIALGCALHAAPAAAEANPVATQKALGSLLAAANDAIPRTSSCHGDYGQAGKARVKDLLAMRLAYLYAGTNVIEGSCNAAQQCTVAIQHAAGEDVASATITFTASGGKARASTLQCVVTP